MSLSRFTQYMHIIKLINGVASILSTPENVEWITVLSFSGFQPEHEEKEKKDEEDRRFRPNGRGGRKDKKCGSFQQSRHEQRKRNNRGGEW